MFKIFCIQRSYPPLLTLPRILDAIYTLRASVTLRRSRANLASTSLSSPPPSLENSTIALPSAEYDRACCLYQRFGRCFSGSWIWWPLKGGLRFLISELVALCLRRIRDRLTSRCRFDQRMFIVNLWAIVEKKDQKRKSVVYMTTDWIFTYQSFFPMLLASNNGFTCLTNGRCYCRMFIYSRS